MRKTLILSLLLFLVPVSAETSTEENVEERAAKFNKFLAHTIRSHGWECEEIVRSVHDKRNSSGRTADGRPLISLELTCKNGKYYYYRVVKEENGLLSKSVCYNGECKELK